MGARRKRDKRLVSREITQDPPDRQPARPRDLKTLARHLARDAPLNLDAREAAAVAPRAAAATRVPTTRTAAAAASPATGRRIWSCCRRMPIRPDVRADGSLTADAGMAGLAGGGGGCGVGGIDAAVVCSVKDGVGHGRRCCPWKEQVAARVATLLDGGTASSWHLT